MFSGRFCTQVRVQVQCASTVFSITWIRLQRTFFLLIILIYARLRNAQRTWFRSSPRCGKSLHCMLLRSDGSLPTFPFSGIGRERRCLCVTIGSCGQNPLQRVFGQKKIEVFFFGPGSIEKALLRGCGGVGRNSFAQTRDSIYGRMTLTTRHTLAARHSSSMVAFISR